MRVSLDIKQLAVLLVLVALFILIIFLIRLALKLTDTLRHVDELLADTKRVTKVAAERTEQVDEQIDHAVEMFADIKGKIDDNRSIIKTAGTVGTAAGAVRAFGKKSSRRNKRYDDEKAYSSSNRIRRRRKR